MQTSAHDPIFAPGPHVLYRGGVEVAAQWQRTVSAGEYRDEVVADAAYGLTADWSIGLEVPYQTAQRRGQGGLGDIALRTKYRFWHRDTLGAQSSAAALLTVQPDTNGRPGSGTADLLVGLALGYESRRWYRWIGIRYRANGDDERGIDRGDRLLLDLVAGVRPWLTGYLEPDTVLMMELNVERTWRSHGMRVGHNGGGREAFIAPGVFWTYRNFALKAGVQIPVYRSLNAGAPDSDLRSRVIVEWHF